MEPDGRTRYSPGFEDWEMAAINYAARLAREPQEQEELRAELARKVLVLRSRPRTKVTHWKAYVTTSLIHEAKRWLILQRSGKSTVSLDADAFEDTDHLPVSMLRRLSVHEGDFGVAARQFWQDLRPEDQNLLILLEEASGNQVAVAKILGIHRNTVALWLKRIRKVWKKHCLPTP